MDSRVSLDAIAETISIPWFFSLQSVTTLISLLWFRNVKLVLGFQILTFRNAYVSLQVTNHKALFYYIT
jgi:hypothetical protein